MKINYIFSALSLVAIMLTSSFAIAQNNEGFSYQSIIRDTDGLPIDNQNVSIRVGIYEGSTSGPLVYQETHTVTTSDVGLISLIISEGTVVSGDFSVIDAIKTLKPLKAVYGNIDDAKMRAEYPEHLVFKCEGVQVYMTHIGGYPPKYNNRSRPVITEEKPKLYICGHSHILKVMPDKKLGLIHMNPGAVGKHGFHKVRTMLKFCINDSNIEQLEVVEFQNRY